MVVIGVCYGWALWCLGLLWLGDRADAIGSPVQATAISGESIAPLSELQPVTGFTTL